MNRRGFLKSVTGLFVAPAIVRADSLMRIVPVDTAIITTSVNITGGVLELWPGVKQWWGKFYLGDIVTLTPTGISLAKIHEVIHGIVVGHKPDGQPIIETNPNKVYEIALPINRAN